ncbi:hypothetical protein LDENG_00096270 [Lucifuga dentata]|nr:hypothetical protein LDENG_00096270 [Lucifuga dentata]
MEKLHQKFESENVQLKISRSQFCKHRPFWIVRPRVTDRETCACKIHENFKAKVQKLHQLGVISSISTSSVVSSSVCDQNNIKCMYRRCEHCKAFAFPTTLDPDTKNNVVSWKEWVSRSEPVTKRNADGSTTECDARIMALEKRSASVERLVDITKDDLPRFTIHVYNIQHPGTVTQIVDEQYEVDTMSRAGENRFFVPSITFPGDKVWYFQSDIKSVIPTPMPATSSARHFSVLPEIWNKLKKT